MKERGIVFSGPMVQAILDDRKRMTRRLVKPPTGCEQFEIHERGGKYNIIGLDGDDFRVYRKDGTEAISFPPYGEPGDRLYVREAWRTTKIWDDKPPREIMLSAPIRLEADGMVISNDAWEGGWGRYRHARFMPCWASRITLEVVGLRAERLQDISEEDAIAEGINRISHGREGFYYHAFRNKQSQDNWISPIDAFRELWESIHGPGSWEENPWLWVYEFKRVQGGAA